MVQLSGKWGSLLAIATVAIGANAQVIDDMITTTHDFKVFGAPSNPKLEFKAGDALKQSVEADGKTPLKIGITIDETKKGQKMERIGVGITDSVAIALLDVRKENPDVYCEILNLLYSQKDEWIERGGAGLNGLRTPLGASDFGVEYYTYDDPEKCGVETDENFEYFDAKNASPKLWTVMKDIIAVVEDNDVGAKASVSMLPWTSPAWIKDNKSYVNGGRILEKYEGWYAQYLAKAVKEIEELGIKIDFLSFQESPQHKDAVVPTTRMTSDQQLRIAGLTRKELDKLGSGKDLVFSSLEASWDTLDYAQRIYGNDTDHLFPAIAWQGYAGSPVAQKTLADQYPGLITRFTEITSVLQNEPWENFRNGAWKILTNAIEFGTQDVFMWNGVLKSNDEMTQTSPSLPNACKICSASILIFGKAQGTLDSQSQLDYCTKDSPRLDWTDIAGLVNSCDADSHAKLLNTYKDNNIKSLSGLMGTGTTTSTDGEPVHKRSLKHHRRQNPPTGLPKLSRDKCFADRPEFKYEPTNCHTFKPQPPRDGNPANFAVDGYYAATSDFALLRHLSYGVRARGGSDWAYKLAVTSTDQPKEGDGTINGRIMAQAYEAALKDGTSRFCVVLFNWNDNNKTDFEPVTAVVSFRGKTVEVTTDPGVHTFCWKDKSGPAPGGTTTPAKP